MDPAVIAALVMAVITLIQNCPDKRKSVVLARLKSPGVIDRLRVRRLARQKLDASPEDWNKHVEPLIESQFYSQAASLTTEDLEELCSQYGCQLQDG
jgi:hypothetical protein